MFTSGATPIDFAYGIDQGNIMVGAYVNGEYVSVDYELHNKDRVRILTDVYSYGFREEWLDKVKTTNAKIIEFLKK